MAENLTLDQALAELQEAAPDAPFLALGQTIFWDEPMKGAIVLASRKLGYDRELVAGVHDTDYFAKLPSGRRQAGKFRALPHNDTSTKGLWSAAAEFSTLFGSETVISRETLHAAGLKIGKIVQDRPRIMDEATEAWGWKGIVSLDEQPPVTAEVPLKGLFHELYATLEWAIDGTLACLTGADREAAESLSEKLKELVCAAADRDSVHHLGELYKSLISEIYDFCANRSVGVLSTTTTELLKFNTETAGKARFRLLDLFLKNVKEAAAAYDEAIRGSEIYPLTRFGTGAIPFDLVIPGLGRGTIRIAPKAITIMTPTPQFITLKRPVASAMDLAAAIETKFGKNCVLVGKAVALIGMLAAEYVFIFHEGASPYVKYSRRLHDLLAPLINGLHLNPILRVRYSPWDELDTCCAWLRLPEPFRQTFGAEDICAPSFSARWRQVVDEQERLLARLGQLRRPIELIRFLSESVGGSWNVLAAEYETLHEHLENVKERVDSLRERRRGAYEAMRQARLARVEAEKAKGAHFRERIFEKEPSNEDIADRKRLTADAERAIGDLKASKLALRGLMKEQDAIVKDAQVVKFRDRRRSIEVEAELKRLSLIRNAVITGRGLVRANNRPSAWWFPLLCPDGLWFRSTVDNAECYLEPLQQPSSGGAISRARK